jgi:diguanylate cyclase (GGDEF)-like protein/PAS domain S-box-containing protein
MQEIIKPQIVSGVTENTQEMDDYIAKPWAYPRENIFEISFSAAPFGMALMHQDGHFMMANPALRKMLGYPEAEFLGFSLADITHPDDRCQTQQLIKRLYAGELEGDNFQLERRYRHQDGRFLWGALSVSLVRNAFGNPLCAMAQIIDITDKKCAETVRQGHTLVLERLAGGAPLPQLLALLIEHIQAIYPHLLCTLKVFDQQDAVILYAAQESPADFCKRSCGCCDRPARAGMQCMQASSAWQVVVADISSHPYWMRYPDLREPSFCGVCWSQPILTSTGKVLGVFELYHQHHDVQQGHLDDVESTAHLAGIAIERTRAEDAIRESEAKYRDLVETSQDLIWIVDAQGRWTFVNHAAAETIYGFEPEEILGRPFTDLVAFGRQQKDLAAFELLRQQGFLFDHDTVHLRKDGSPVYLNFNAILMRNEKGQVLGAAGTARDVSEQHRAAEALQRYQNELEQQVERRTLELRTANQQLQAEIKEREQAERELQKSAAEWTYAMDFFTEAICLVDLDDRLLRANRAFFALTGHSPASAIGQDIASILHPEIARSSCPVCEARRLKRNQLITLEAEHPTNPCGQPVEVRIQVIGDETARPAAIMLGIHDLSERRKAEAILRKSEKSLAQAQRVAHIGNWEYDLQRHTMFWSDEVFRIFELDPQLTNPSLEAMVQAIHPDDREGVERAYRNAVQAQLPYHMTHRLLMPDGRTKYVEEWCEISVDAQGKAVSSIGTLQDITERRYAERLLFEEKERAQVTLKSIADAVISTDAAGRIDFLNPIAESLTGWDAPNAQGRPLAQVYRIVSEETGKSVEDPVSLCLKAQKAIELTDQHVLLSRAGSSHAVEESAAPILRRDGSLLGAVLVFRDVTAARNLSQKVSYQAKHDALTGLINRGEFERRLERVVHTAQSTTTQSVLCYLDLDQFKRVNDTCGHVAGDELLRQVSQLFQQHIRKRDTLARLGGDEFGLLMEHCSLHEARGVAENLIRAIADFSFPWDEHSFSIGVSIGLVAVDQLSPAMGQLLDAADNACYLAKEQGRNRVHVHRASDGEKAQRQGEMPWSVRLPQALAEERFRLYYQPIRRSTDDADRLPVDQYEILLQMCGEGGELVPPGAFLPAAERYSLAEDIDRWVITQMFRWLRDHPKQRHDLKLCAINLSGPSLGSRSFLSFVIHEMDSIGLDSRKICFEIKETAAIANLSSAKRFIEALRPRGCRFTLDDFGSGLSSFNYLKNLPVDFLKIDGVFVKDILTDPIDLAMVKSINEIGHVMGKQTIAEFVEDEAILHRLREIGVDYVQGYAIARPSPLGGLLDH